MHRRSHFERLRTEFARSDKKNTTVQTLKEAVEKRLLQMLKKNPLRTNFQTHYEKIVAEYNDEKDRVTIEQTFEALLKLVEGLGDEEKRAVREGLEDDETLAFFDLLIKPELSKKDIDKIKKVARGLHGILEEEISRVQDFHAKQATRDAMKTRIHDYLFDDNSGLPESFGPEEIDEKAVAVLAHLVISSRYAHVTSHTSLSR